MQADGELLGITNQTDGMACNLLVFSFNQFPNFWIGLSNRANCYRRLGMTAKAEMDEFRIFKAQMNKHIGIQYAQFVEKDLSLPSTLLKMGPMLGLMAACTCDW